MASIEERFQAAVNVIKGLPKNGPYQPSISMMLKFYGLYKQATEGPCNQKKPGFWDITGKAKWDAWNSNKHLTKEDAMKRYVEELRQIIETMSFTENVQNFVGSIDGLDNINLDELDMIVPGMRELAESHPNSPFNSRTNSPHHNASPSSQTPAPSGATSREELNTAPRLIETQLFNGYLPNDSSYSSLNNASNSENITTTKTNLTPMTNGYAVEQSDDEYDDPINIQSDLAEAMFHNSELLKQVQATVLRMNNDIIAISQRMSFLEKNMGELKAYAQKNRNSNEAALRRKYPKWWPFTNISPSWFALLIFWPFIVNRMSRLLASPKKR